jgi:CheY-like chemotaxis protein
MAPEVVAEAGGLGLAISRQYVHIMGGELEIDATVGHCTQFHFTIEAPEAVAGEVLASLPILAPRDRGRRLLVVDAVVDSRHLLRSMLAPAGFEVHEAADGAEALDAITQLKPELVLMDWRMPGLDGLEITRRLRADHSLPQPRLVLMASPAIGDGRQQALAAGADDVLGKPVEQGKLFRLLQQQLGLQYVEGVLP